jgi:DNA-binding IclR family transcriptional regulator
LPISTAYRYLRILSEKGFLEKTDTGTYSLGLRFLELSRAAQNSNRDLKLKILPGMKRIAEKIDETVTLMRLFNKYAICIESIEGQQVVRVTIEQGRLQPIHAGASSKILLAALDESEWDNYLNRSLEALTPETILDVDILKAELYRVRKQGYAISNGEVDLGGRAISVPIQDQRGKVVAALSIEGPAFRMTDDVLPRYLGLLQEEAAMLRREIN